MSAQGYEHWNEEAPIIAAQENDPMSPYADMSDEAIKQAVYDRIDAGEDDFPMDGEE